MNKIYICNVSGNIGVGKSTTIRHMQQHLPQHMASGRIRLHYMLEPIHEWKPYLDRLSQDPSNPMHHINFQLKVLEYHMDQVRRIIQLKEDCDVDHVLILERTPLDVLHVFMPIMESNPNIPTEKYDLLLFLFKKFYAIMLGLVPKEQWMHIHIKVQHVHNLIEHRIRERQQSGDSGLTFNYLNRLQQLHDTWFMDQDTSEPRTCITIETHDIAIEDSSQRAWTFIHNQCVSGNGHDDPLPV